MKNKKIYETAFSQINITPEFPTELIGCYREDNRADGVLDELYAQVILFKDEADIFCLIAIDNLGLTIELGNTLREAVASELNTAKAHVMLNFSHTHSAPCPAGIALNGDKYFDFMRRQIIEAVVAASQKFVPSKAAWAMTDTEIGENRRDGCDIIDNRLGALKIADAKTAQPLVVILRLTAHANVLMSQSNAISSDYFGMARQVLGEYFGCPVMLIQGAAGNIKPIGVDKINGGTAADIIPIVEKLKLSAEKLVFTLSEIQDIQMFSKELTYTSDVPAKAEAKKIATASKMDARDWLTECERLRKSGITTQTQKREIQFLKINHGCICGVPDEIFCEISIEASKLINNKFLFMNGYTNACTGYLPTEEEWSKGGYETLYSYLTFYPFHGHVMPFRDNTAKQIVALVKRTWDQIQSDLIKL